MSSTTGLITPATAELASTLSALDSMPGRAAVTIALSADYMLTRWLQPSVKLTVFNPGVGLAVRAVPMNAQWSPFVGVLRPLEPGPQAGPELRGRRGVVVHAASRIIGTRRGASSPVRGTAAEG